MHKLMLIGTAGALLASACGDTGRTSNPDGSTRDGGPGRDSNMDADASVDGSESACTVGRRRCGPTSNVVQSCPDGTGWVDETACELTAGETCSVGECVEIHRTPECARLTEERSYIGCEFWGASLANSQASGETFVIAIANAGAFPVDVLIEGGALDSPMTLSLGVEELQNVELPWVPDLAFAAQATGGEVTWESGLVSQAGYRIRSTGPVTAVQFNPWTGASSNDASSLLPVSALGERYMTLSTVSQHPMDPADWPASFAVVGTQDSETTVTVTQSADTAAGDDVSAGSQGETSTYMLGRGDVLQVLGATLDDDLSGTLIEASAPVAVFSGHVCANLPDTACDHLEEQAPPLTAWGRSYVATTFGETETVPFVVRVIAGDAGSTVTFDPASVSDPVTLASGETHQIETTGQFAVDGDEPVLVAQMVSGRGLGGEDPSMVYATPTEQHRPQSLFFAPEAYDENFVNLIGPSGGAPMVDGAPVTVAPAAIGSSGLSVWRVPLTPGVHQIGHTDATEAFGIVAYGFEFAGSYAYTTGMNQQIINPPI